MGFPIDKATKTWEHAGLQCAIAPADCNPNGGTAYNRYVRVPQGSDWHGRDYDTINQIMWDNEDDWPEAARLVGGASELTYNNRDGWIGFGTLHAGDRWPEDMLDPEHMPTSPYETAWTMDRLQDAVNAWAEIVAHEDSPLAQGTVLRSQDGPIYWHDAAWLPVAHVNALSHVDDSDHSDLAGRARLIASWYRVNRLVS